MDDVAGQGGAGSARGGALGAALRAGRVARELTLQDLAEALRACGLATTKSYLSEVETGKRPPPPDEWLVAAERVLRLPAGSLVEAARWDRTPKPVRERVSSLTAERRIDRQKQRELARRLSELVTGSTAETPGAVRGKLDAAFRSGELGRLVAELESPAGAEGGRGRDVVPQPLPQEVPLINSVAAGYPREFTDMGYPARVADEYIRVPDLADADAFAARVVGDSMAPAYVEGDIVVFSPAKAVKSGADCFARLDPDQASTFKRVYFETGPAGEEMIRLQPINPAYPPRTLPRESVAGLYAAVSVMRKIG